MTGLNSLWGKSFKENWALLRFFWKTPYLSSDNLQPIPVADKFLPFPAGQRDFEPVGFGRVFSQFVQRFQSEPSLPCNKVEHLATIWVEYRFYGNPSCIPQMFCQSRIHGSSIVGKLNMGKNTGEDLKGKGPHLFQSSKVGEKRSPHISGRKIWKFVGKFFIFAAKIWKKWQLFPTMGSRWDCDKAS